MYRLNERLYVFYYILPLHIYGICYIPGENGSFYEKLLADDDILLLAPSTMRMCSAIFMKASGRQSAPAQVEEKPSKPTKPAQVEEKPSKAVKPAQVEEEKPNKAVKHSAPVQLEEEKTNKLAKYP